MGPFVERESKNLEYLLCRWFTEVAAKTSMVDTFWKSRGHAYALKKRIADKSCDVSDLQLAREIFAGFKMDHPIMAYVFFISKDANWNIESGEILTFCRRANARSFKEQVAQLRCLDEIQKAAERMAYPEMVADAQGQWEVFSTALFAELTI